MDAKLAVNILENTFKQKFDIERFEYFLTELFNEIDINTVDEKHFLKDFYKKYVNHFYTLGGYQSIFNERIGIYAVELSNESSRDRARTMQRNLIVDMMKNTNKDGALVAFYTNDSDDWRFSYIKRYFKFGENGLKEELSAPRRHSFLVGPNEPNHTCQTQFLNLLISEDKISLKQIDEAFNIENVTDEFFKEYSDLVKSLVKSLTEIKENDSVVCDEFDSRFINSPDFAKKLMGQLVFMYFLQKKGWLGVEKEKKWGTGPKDFLRKIFNKCRDEGKNFFNDVLEPLFYKGFAEEVSDFHYSEFGYKVPFLNGALFEPINNYDWVKTDVNLKNSIFDNIFKTFDKFNFTVKEDEPLEKEVAVDPEMLGKVFESLLESHDRKQKGAFYTPRKIVHYMCQENLIYYLKTNTDIPEDDLRKFITKGYLAIEHIIKVNDAGKKIKKIPYIHDSIKENSDKLDTLLKNVKVIDPAVGSGAFPVGMLNEIITARYILRLMNNVHNINFYQLKKETILNSLYGVDLELSAADVTKLRFWLSLIVDEESIDEIEPLPNLDNQIMCGNSVIDGYENVRLFDEELIIRSSQTKLAMTPTEQIFEKLERKKRDFFNVCGPVQKQKLRDEIKEIKWEFIEARLRSIGRRDLIEKIKEYKYRDDRPFFVWELEFSEIFKGENPGFDIVIGNPPYVKNEKIVDIKPYLKNHYKTYQGKADLYVYFFEKGMDILKNNGVFAFICSNKFVNAKYGEELRKFLLNHQLIFYDDCSGKKIFKEATVDTCIIQIKKSYLENNSIKINKKFEMKQNVLTFDSWTFTNPKVLILKEKILDNSTLVNNLNIDIKYGLKTGYNKAYLINNSTYEQLISSNINNKKIIKPILKGTDIDKFKIDFKDRYIIIVKHWNGKTLKQDYPDIYNYLIQFESKLKNRGQVKNGQHHWLDLDNNVTQEYLDNFNLNKIIWQRVCKEPNFALDLEKNCILDSMAFLISEDNDLLYLLLAIFNSQLIKWYLKLIGHKYGKTGFLVSNQYVKKLPIPKMSPLEKQELIELSKKIIKLSNEENENKNYLTKLFTQLNNKIYEIYNLSDSEIAIINDEP